jgi:hypothetical protein
MAGLVSLLCLGCFYLDWRGQRAWYQCQHDIEAKGINLDWKGYIPPPVPDDQKFFKARKMQAWFEENPYPYDNRHNELWELSTNKYTTASITNMNRAKEYLSWSGRFKPEFDLIRTALRRPYARIGGDYSNPLKMPEPNFVDVRSVSRTFALRAKSDLLVGKPDEALCELDSLNQLRQVLHSPPSGKPVTIISTIIDISIAGLYGTTVEEGQRSHFWKAPQLESLQKQLQQINLSPRTMEAMREDIVWNYRFFQKVLIPHYRANREGFLTGWFLQNLVTIAKFDLQAMNDVDISNNTIFPDKLDNWEIRRVTFQNQCITTGNFLATSSIPPFSEMWQKTAYYQTLINEAQIGCAQERYYLAHGHYPETLDALVPDFMNKIPHDIIGGQPLHYRRISDTKFLLYSVGWNQKDDGGQKSPHDKNGTIDYTNGDWALQN